MLRIGKLPNSANRSSLVSLVLSTQGQCRVLEPLLFQVILVVDADDRTILGFPEVHSSNKVHMYINVRLTYISFVKGLNPGVIP